MNTNARNARVVICLILAMTAGARTLLWLEPAPTITGQFPLLTAMGGRHIEDVVIQYAPPGEELEAGACLIWHDGTCDYGQPGPHVRLVVVGTPEGPLPEAQKQTLLEALGSIAWGRGTRGAETPAIHLDPSTRINQGLLPQARELYDMLVAKRFID